MTKTTFKEIKIGDLIQIAIQDCGSGIATVLSKDKNSMTIRIDVETFTTCYDCQTVVSSLMDVHEDEIHEVQLVHRFKKDSYHKHDGTLIKPENEIDDLEKRTKCVIKAVKAAPPVETIAKGEYAFRVLSEDNTFWCDVYPDKVRFAYARESDNPMPIPGYGVIINYFKEDVTMSKSVKENKTIKEETKMKKNVNVHAAGYLTKDKIREQIEALGGKPMSNHEFKSTKRDKLLEMLEKAKAQQPTITEATKEVAPVQLDKRREKYNLFCHLVKTKALENQKKGYGHVVSAYMLCALILKADCGLEKLKGNEDKVTDEQRAKVKEIRNFMINKGHLKAVTWSCNNVTYYSSEYDGNNKNFMVPIEKAPKDAKLAVTTYKVMW